jgi:hypothetical protein
MRVGVQRHAPAATHFPAVSLLQSEKKFSFHSLVYKSIFCFFVVDSFPGSKIRCFGAIYCLWLPVVNTKIQFSSSLFTCRPITESPLMLILLSVLFNNFVSCYDYAASAICKPLNMKHRWNYTQNGN